MKYIRTNEEYAYERRLKREKEAFDKLGPIVKKRKYDVNLLLKKLLKDYPSIKDDVSIINYYSTKAKCIFISDDCNYLNSWNRDSDNYTDGVNKKLAKWIKSKGFEFSWHTAPNGNWWDGIIIKPQDTNGHFWYYNEPVHLHKIKVREDKSSLYKVIKGFQDKGFDVYEPDDVEENDKNSTDRDIVEMNKYGMTFRFFVLRQGNINQQIDEEITEDEMTIDRHLPLIKKIYEYCETVAEGPLWTMCGGGMQLQQFYGDDNGYIGILYLDMKDKYKYINPNNFTFQSNGKDHKNKFKKLNYKKLVNSKEIQDFYNMKRDTNKYNL